MICSLFSLVKTFRVSYSDQVFGAAIFDLNGLPREYFVSAESADISWVQTIFQALGLQALLSSAFQLADFRHAIIDGAHFHAIIVRRPDCHVALLIHQNEVILSEEVIQWAINFDPTTLSSDPRFMSS
jgi:hypothetical protein